MSEKIDTRGRYMLERYDREKRAQIMRERAHQRWEKTTKKERKAIAHVLVQAKRNARKTNKKSIKGS